jgi:endoglucanase
MTMLRNLFALTLFAMALIPSTIFAASKPAGDGIRLSSIGYVPDVNKIATVVGAKGDGTAFRIVDAKTKAVVYEGKLSDAMQSLATKETARLADFSHLSTTGYYVMQIDGLPDSAPFAIAPNSVNRSLHAVMLGFYGQRCGEAVMFDWNGHIYAHEPCHTGASGLDYYDKALAGKTKDATGGWHDAGDYGKYSLNGAFACAIMLNAWERNGANLASLKLPIHESGGAIPDYLAEVKYNLDWLLKMQMEDGRVSHKVTTLNFCGMILPDEDKQPTYFAPWDKQSTINFAAVGCMAARVYRQYDAAYADKWLAAAKKAWLAVRDVPDFRPDLSAFHTGVYLCDPHSDTMWALIEMHLAFGDDFLTENERHLLKGALDDDDRVFRVTWDWGNAYNLGLYDYLFSDKAKQNPARTERLKKDLLGAADAILENDAHHAYGRGLRVYYWGVNGAVARTSMNLQAAYLLTGDAKYRNAAYDQIAYLYGRNPYSRSFVTGDGINPPMFPHHRPSAGDVIEQPWPGHLVGGPNPTELDWHDETGSFSTNENAINWDAALAYALSMFYMPEAR